MSEIEKPSHTGIEIRLPTVLVKRDSTAAPQEIKTESVRKTRLGAEK